VFFKDSRTLLVVFLSGAQRHDASQRLQAIISRYSLHGHPSIFSLILRDMSIALPGGRTLNTPHEKALATAQQQWCNREISNVYLLAHCLVYILLTDLGDSMRTLASLISSQGERRTMPPNIPFSVCLFDSDLYHR